MIGTTHDGVELTLDAESLIGTHLAIIGNSGAGKSYTLRKILEETRDSLIQIVLDTEDEFHTLCEVHPYELIRPRIPSPPRLARRLIEQGRSAIIQINDLPINERRRFIATFLEALIALPRQLWRPVLVVIDEADRYAPQSGRCESTAAVTALMSQGRKRGFTGVLATQRLAKINKSATGDVNNWIIGRVGQALDGRTAADALGFSRQSDEATSMRFLKTGQFWCVGPALSPMPQLVTIAPSITHHLEPYEAWCPKQTSTSPQAVSWPFFLFMISIIVAGLSALLSSKGLFFLGAIGALTSFIIAAFTPDRST